MTDRAGRVTPEEVLATDLDGTLIPLDGNEQNVADLRLLSRELAQGPSTLVFATGRHFQSVVQAIDDYSLPRPEWVICDVGTSIFERQAAGDFATVAAYQQHLDEIIAARPIGELRDQLSAIRGLRLQEERKQGRFKLSYYVDATQIERLVHTLRAAIGESPYDIIHSIDPFNGDGLIDVLPTGASKAHALAWWTAHVGLNAGAVVYAGDSGNDLAPLTSGFRAIVVGNADRRLARAVYDKHRDAKWHNRLFLAQGAATSGVVEGCRWFGLLKSDVSPPTSIGATPLHSTAVHFRVWAPDRKRVDVEILEGNTPTRQPLVREADGYFAGHVSGIATNTRYQYMLDGRTRRPDPASRYQPEGVHGASQVFDPGAFPWTDQQWPGIDKRDLVIYELHLGTFTRDGTFAAAVARLDDLVELGVTAVEIMPVAQSPGRWNWGYDGVDLYAVRNTYGTPAEFQALVDACHARGLAVLLDVVYNHLGPEGNYLGEYGPYFSKKHRTPWGEALNFDGRHSEHTRRFIIENAIFWLRDFHLDGLRLDAVHFMLDESKPTILDEIRTAVTDFQARVKRRLHLIAETNTYDHDLLRRQDGRDPYDAIWCDCLMHSIYSHAVPDLNLSHRPYRGGVDLATALQDGYVFAGRSATRTNEAHRRRLRDTGGARSHLASLVTAVQNHDSVGNHPHGKRIHQLVSKRFQQASAVLNLLYPGIPLLFMGEEFASDAPFPFFADFEDSALRNAVDKGRCREYSQHDWRDAPLPSSEAAFLSANLDAARDRDADMRDWYRSLLALRREGIASGWLTPSNLSSEYDARKMLFTMRFDQGPDHAVVVQARLSGSASPIDDLVTMEINGDVLLSTSGTQVDSRGRVQLGANDAVVWRK